MFKLHISDHFTKKNHENKQTESYPNKHNISIKLDKHNIFKYDDFRQNFRGSQPKKGHA